MFESVRRHQRIFLGLILLLIIPSFVVVGAWDLISPAGDRSTVAKVGRQKIELPQWERAHQQTLERIRAQFGGRVDPALLDTPAARNSTLNDMVTQQVLFQTALKLRVQISDAQVRQTISGIPAVQKDGRFDMGLYQQALKAQGLTLEGFEQQVRNDLMVEVVPASVAGTTLVPRSVARRLAQAALEARSLRIKKFPIADFMSAVTVTDADIEEFYKSNQALFQTQEEVDIALVAFSKPGSADMVEQFSNLVYEQADTLEPAAKKFGLPIQTIRSVRRQGVAAGADKISAEAQRALSNPKLLAALFNADALANKRNTEAVEIAPGLLASARVVAHRPAAAVPLAVVKSQVEKAIRDRKAAEMASAQADASSKAFAASQSIPPGSLPSRTLVRSDLQKAAAELPAELLQAAFSAEVKSLPVAVSVPASSRSNAAWLVVIESAQVPASDSASVKELLAKDFQRLERAAAADTIDRWVAMARESVGVKTYPEKLSKTDNR